MKIPWKPLLQYQLTDVYNAQYIYEQIFHTALRYRYNSIKGLAVKVDYKDITDAIFGINAQDKIILANKEINGQKLKELFVVSIMLKQLETRFTKGDYFFISIPEQENSCDVAVFVVKESDMVFITDTEKKQLTLPDKHLPFSFQVKEYFDYEEYKKGANKLREAKIERLDKMVEGYEEIVLVFMRNYEVYKSEKFKEFFLKNKGTYLISVPDQVMIDGKNPIELDASKHNYIITFPIDKFSIESFNKPRLLLTDEEYRQFRKSI